MTSTPTPRRPLGVRPSLGNSYSAIDSDTHDTYTEDTPKRKPGSARNGSFGLGQSTTTRPSFAPTDRAAAMEDHETALEVGDTVEVPGGMTGLVKYIGGVKGKKGAFVGVELSRQFAARGKNDGDVDGVRYFSTSIPGAGIFLPSHRAAKTGSPTLSAESFPPTPTTPGFARLDLNSRTNSGTPPTPSLPKFSQTVGPGSRPNFSQSVGPGARAASPQLKAPKGRPSLPRPESPLRKQPNLQPPQNGASGRTSTPGGFSSSLRGGRPPMALSPAPKRTGPPKPQTPQPARTNSRSQSRQDVQSPEIQKARPSSSRLSNGGIAANHTKQTSNVSFKDEVQQLEHALDERDKQLKEQASSLAEMESSLAELQSMMAANAGSKSPPPPVDSEGVDMMQLRGLLREKNEKIAMLTTEFDTHRADFRSTIDTLEMASTETERVYEKRVEELLRENQDLQEGRDDVESVAAQLKQLEELVAELEDGLEDARRGEAEARSEVEFLRGEVERGHSELRKEREKGARALKGAGAAVGSSSASASPRNSRDVAQRDDEIRGLKAIIHSLSSGPDMGTPKSDGRNSLQAANSGETEELARLKESMENLQREKGELRGLVERKNYREEELERELNNFRRNSQQANNDQSEAIPNGQGFHAYNKSSISSTKTAIRPNSRPTSGRTNSRGSFSAFPQPMTPASPSKQPSQPPLDRTRTNSSTGIKITTIAEPPIQAPSVPSFNHNDNTISIGSPNAPHNTTGSEASVESTLWCEICEAPGHDVLSCTNIGTDASKGRASIESARKSLQRRAEESAKATGVNGASKEVADDSEKETFLDVEEKPSVDDANGAADAVALDAGGEGPAPGKESKIVDMSKWCALCERDGHESVDCPFDDY